MPVVAYQPPAEAPPAMSLFHYGCCVSTAQTLWVLIMTFIVAVLAVISCCLAAVFVRWVYKRRLRKKVSALKEKYHAEVREKQERVQQLQQIAKRPVIPHVPNTDAGLNRLIQKVTSNHQWNNANRVPTPGGSPQATAFGRESFPVPGPALPPLSLQNGPPPVVPIGNDPILPLLPPPAVGDGPKKDSSLVLSTTNSLDSLAASQGLTTILVDALTLAGIVDKIRPDPRPRQPAFPGVMLGHRNPEWPAVQLGSKTNEGRVTVLSQSIVTAKRIVEEVEKTQESSGSQKKKENFPYFSRKVAGIPQMDGKETKTEDKQTKSPEKEKEKEEEKRKIYNVYELRRLATEQAAMAETKEACELIRNRNPREREEKKKEEEQPETERTAQLRRPSL